MKRILGLLIVTVLVTSCVSKKKYVQLEQNLIDTKGELQQTTLEKEELETKMAAIEKRVEIYNANINSLQTENATLQASNDQKMDFLDDNSTVMSANMRANLDATLAQLTAEELKGAKTLKDSMNLAIAHNLKQVLARKVWPLKSIAQNYGTLARLSLLLRLEKQDQDNNSAYFQNSYTYYHIETA